mgnify:FL=1
MKFKTYLQQVDKNRIKELTKQHNIYYNPDFSRRWISNQVADKLIQKRYLKDLIEKHFSSSDQEVLQKLLITDSINKNSVEEKNYHKLLDYGLIYQRNKFCYLFSDLKPILQEILSTATTKQNSNKSKKFKIKSDLSDLNIEKNKCNLSFFHYLILTIAQIKQLSEQKNRVIKKDLLAFVEKINSTNLNSQTLYNKILDYSLKHNLISRDFKINPNFKSWLQTPQQQKILTAINTLVPRSSTALRKIIAVLSHYPLEKKIPLKFAQQELELETITDETKELFHLLNLVKIQNKKISLSKESWQHFNPQVKFKFSQPQTKSQSIIVPSTVELNKLWEIAANNPLISIKDKLVFQNHN